jgi:hypothetical protein
MEMLRPPQCCGKPMRAFASYWSDSTWFAFQCVDCGLVVEKTMDDLDSVEK